MAADLPPDEHFPVEELAGGLRDPMEIAILPNDDIIIVERTGGIKRWTATTGKVSDYHFLDVVYNSRNKYARESGVLGVTADPNFSENQWIYIIYSPVRYEGHRLSRFTAGEDGLTEEKVMLEVPSDRAFRTCHEGGSLAFGPDGLLYISLGDNTCPFESDGYAPIDEQVGRYFFDAQRSAGNTNDLRGGILRIKPEADGTYSIPEGNLYRPGRKDTRPEIYVMGTRNPWRISVDPEKGWLHWGDVGPDSGKTNQRGPIGYCEINQAQKAGNFGWPYFIGENIAYADYDFSSKELGEKFSPDSPRNLSVNNSGRRDLPAPQPAFRTLPRSCHCAGPLIRKGSMSDAPGALPELFNDCLITYDWNNGYVTLAKLDDSGAELWQKPWLRKQTFIHPSDIELGNNRELLVLEYGPKWANNTKGRLLRVTYSEEAEASTAAPKADPRLAGMDLDHPGTQILADGSLCLSCHQSQQKSIGPSYLDVAKKYKEREDAISFLMEKIMKGGVGNWGEIPMPPQPQYNSEQLSQIVEAILKLDAGHEE